MDNKKELSSSRIIQLSETNDGLYLELTGQLCYLEDYNLNGLRLLKGENFEENLKSLIDTPVVAKYVWNEDNGSDFSGHEAYRDWYTGNIMFDTDAIGVHQDVWVENKAVKPVFSEEEKELPVIMYKARIWAERFPNFAKVIKKLYSENNLGTSWELIPNKITEETSNIIGITNPRSSDDYEFVGNCLLGSDVIGAYEGTSKVTNVASANLAQKQLSEALNKDLKNNSKKEKEISQIKEGSKDMDKKIQELESKLAEAVAKLQEYEEAGKDKQISELETKVKALEIEKSETEEKFVKATENLETVTAELEELKPYKAQVEAINLEKAEHEKKEKIIELTEMVKKGGYITDKDIETSEEIKKLIQDCNEDALKVLRAEKIIEKHESEQSQHETETSEAKTKLPKQDFAEETKVSKNAMDTFLV